VQFITYLRIWGAFVKIKSSRSDLSQIKSLKICKNTTSNKNQISPFPVHALYFFPHNEWVSQDLWIKISPKSYLYHPITIYTGIKYLNEYKLHQDWWNKSDWMVKIILGTIFVPNSLVHPPIHVSSHVCIMRKVYTPICSPVKQPRGISINCLENTNFIPSINSVKMIFFSFILISFSFYFIQRNMLFLDFIVYTKNRV
jgi:hypothetical protein